MHCDDVKEAETWAALLRQLGLEVVSAGLQAQDWEVLENRVFDLIVISSHDNRTGAIPLCPRLRSQFINPIILLGTASGDEQVIEAYNAGADDYVPAPITPELFRVKVRAWLRHAWTASASGLEDIWIGVFSLDSCARELHVSDRPPEERDLSPAAQDRAGPCPTLLYPDG